MKLVLMEEDVLNRRNDSQKLEAGEDRTAPDSCEQTSLARKRSGREGRRRQALMDVGQVAEMPS